MDVGESQARLVPQAASPIRTVSLLGATGSVGTSTIDLLKRGNGRYQVEAVTANRNATAARTDRARAPRPLCRRGRPRGLSRAEGRAFRQRHRSGKRRGRAGRSRRAAGRLGDGGDQRLGRAETDARRRPARRDRGARQQGMPGLRRRCVHAHGGRQRRQRVAGRFRAQRDLPGTERRPARGREPHRDHRLRRTVPHLDARSDAGGDASNRPSSIPTGRWARRSPSIRQPC